MGNHWKVITRFVMTRFLFAGADYSFIKKITLLQNGGGNQLGLYHPSAGER